MKKGNSSPKPKEKWELLGVICVGKRRSDEQAHAFKISFTAYSPSQARKIGLERLKAFSRREKEAAKVKKFSLDGVFLVNGTKLFSLKQRFSNNSVLFAVRPRLVFENIPITGMVA